MLEVMNGNGDLAIKFYAPRAPRLPPELSLRLAVLDSVLPERSRGPPPGCLGLVALCSREELFPVWSNNTAGFLACGCPGARFGAAISGLPSYLNP